MECAVKCETVIRVEEDVKNLHGWQKQQNGSIKVANDKIDKLDEKFDKKFDTLMYWLMAQMAATIIAAITIYHTGK